MLLVGTVRKIFQKSVPEPPQVVLERGVEQRRALARRLFLQHRRECAHMLPPLTGGSHIGPALLHDVPRMTGLRLPT
jgi:hypothetical protein